jgi:hypothetical protein
MNTISFVDFARCECNHLTAVRASSAVIPRVTPQPSEPYAESILVACTGCKRVYHFDTDELETHQTTKGIGPSSPDAPLTIFRVPISCDELNCQAQIQIIATLSSKITPVELEKEKASWRWTEGDIACDWGHPLPFPQWH